jgi:DNA-directed RNA polymerase I, II, and III subunit RPABC1
MEVLKTMLRQRGVNVDDTSGLESDLPGETSKIGEYLVHFSSKSRISQDTIDSVLATMKEGGATRAIIVVDTPPSSVVLNVVRKYADVLQLFHTKQLQFDITTHRKVPPHRILTAEEKNAFLEKYRANTEFMPAIDSQDPMAKWIGARPGDIVEILRRSESAASTPYYRVCVANTSL